MLNMAITSKEIGLEASRGELVYQYAHRSYLPYGSHPNPGNPKVYHL